MGSLYFLFMIDTPKTSNLTHDLKFQKVMPWKTLVIRQHIKVLG
jgi:hypothetical protein